MKNTVVKTIILAALMLPITSISEENPPSLLKNKITIDLNDVANNPEYDNEPKATIIRSKTKTGEGWPPKLKTKEDWRMARKIEAKFEPQALACYDKHKKKYPDYEYSTFRVDDGKINIYLNSKSGGFGKIIACSSIGEQEEKLLLESFKKYKEPTITPCKKVMHDFMSKRDYLSKPVLHTEVKAGSTYVCVVQYVKDNVNYSLPIIVEIRYNPDTGTYKYKSL